LSDFRRMLPSSPTCVTTSGQRLKRAATLGYGLRG
jgi:hypothetical protein